MSRHFALGPILEVAGKVLDVAGNRSSRKGFTNHFEYLVPGKVLRIMKNFTNLLFMFQDGNVTFIMD